MCGESGPCIPMHPGCKYSREWAAECLDRYYEARRLLTLRASDWNLAVKQFRDYEITHGKKAAKLLSDEIKRQNQERV